MIRTRSTEDDGLALALVQIDGGTQSRATLNQHVVDDYAEAIQAGATFPPIVVFYDGKKHWLADGFHRFHAYQKAGREKVAADVRQGTRRDAILHSVGANETHGLRRTRDDKRRAVLTLLGDAEWGRWTDREIARACHVDNKTVAKVRSEVTEEIPSERTYTTKHGTTATMKTAGINASRATNFRAENVQVDAADHQKENAVEFVAAQGFDPADRPVAASAEFAQPRNIFDELVSLWKEADAGVRQDFKAYITGSAAVAKLNLRQESDPATTTGGHDVDRGAERASSAVEVGATNSPDGATRSVPSLGHASVCNSLAAREPDESAASNSNPQPKTPGDADKAEAVPPPAVSANSFNNPRCQKPDTCHLAHSRNECFDCNIAWSKRPKDEQVRLWAEAIQASRATA